MSARTKAGRARLERDLCELAAVLREGGSAQGKREALAEFRRRIDLALNDERIAAERDRM